MYTRLDRCNILVAKIMNGSQGRHVTEKSDAAQPRFTMNFPRQRKAAGIWLWSMVPHPVVGNAGICQRRRAAACSTPSAHTRPSPGAALNSSPGYKLKASSTFSLALCLAWRRRHFNLLYPTCSIPACPARPQRTGHRLFHSTYRSFEKGAITKNSSSASWVFYFYYFSERTAGSCTSSHARVPE